jgi:hypothetical protein
MLALFGLLLLVAAPYLTAIGLWIVYDDTDSIVENRFLENPPIWFASYAAHPDRPHRAGQRRPVVVASYFLDRAIWGCGPRFSYYQPVIASALRRHDLESRPKIGPISGWRSVPGWRRCSLLASGV